jgi:hypothetical protein
VSARQAEQLSPAVQEVTRKGEPVATTGLLLIGASFICAVGFIAHGAQLEARRPDLSPATVPRMDWPLRLWLAASLLLSAAGIITLAAHVVGLFTA